MSDHATPPNLISALVDDVRDERRAALRALHVLEYAVTAPAPRRHRTWVHRVLVALDVLSDALQRQLHTADDPLGLLDEIALSHPEQLTRVQQLRQQLLDLTIAVASLREQIEPDPALDIDPDDIRDRLGGVARQFRDHQAREAVLVHEATGLDVDELSMAPRREGGIDV